MRARWLHIVAIVLSIVVILPNLAAGQGRSMEEVNKEFDAIVAKEWPAALAAAASRNGVTVSGRVLQGSAEARSKTLREALDTLLNNQALMDVFDLAYVEQLKNEESNFKRAESTAAVATNPATAGFIERSGATKLLALAADLSNIVGADKSAVTINLNALALVGLKDDGVYSVLRRYQNHETLRRFTGTVTFGAKIPEKDITGLSSLPTFETLLDAFAWDVKVRVLGDRDIRGRKWTDLNIRQLGAKVQAIALVMTMFDAADIANILAFQKEAQTQLKSVTDIAKAVKRSAQLSVKVAGTHLTKVEGKNKLSFTALFDVGAGPADITANVQYAVTDDVRLGLNNLFQVKAWTMSASLTTAFAKGLLARDRTINWAVGANALVFQDKASLPVAAANTFKVVSSLEFPIGEAAKIPFSIVWSNDPNALNDQKHTFSGQVGVSYDFAAVTTLFKK